MSAARTAWVLVVSLGAGCLLPWLVVAGLAAEFESRGLGVINYRGRKVFLGLGVAWVVVAICALAITAAPPGWVPLTFVSWVLRESGIVIAAVLVMLAFALGLLDDAYGSSAERGFSGHLRALRHGRLTTGLLKAAGIGVLGLVAGVAAASITSDIIIEKSFSAFPFLRIAFAGAVVALTANLVNLLDLRPARALKAQALLAIPFAVVLGVRAAETFFIGDGRTVHPLIGVACVLSFVIGPVAAVWRYDAGERGMLGDAGANAAGVLAGFLAAMVLPMPWIGLWALVLLGLNLLSERVSFSAVIERNRVLSWLDRLGRRDSERGSLGSSESSSERRAD